jgi:GT2 family glycosyltransferase
MEVSIVIINYNTFALTCQCIESIVRHIRDITFEIIVVDNASTELETEAFVKRYPFIVFIKSPTNIGFAKGNNLGIEKAMGEYILLLNSDAALLNNAVFILKEFLSGKQNVAAVTGRLEYPDGKVQHNCQRFPSIRYKLFELFRLQKFLPQNVGGKVLFGFFFDYNTMAYPDWIWGTCFMFRKQLLEKLPGRKLADDFFMYIEDKQWCWEFRKLGYRVAFVPSARIVHYMGSSGGSKSDMMETNEEFFMTKYYKAWHVKCIRTLDNLLR